MPEGEPIKEGITMTGIESLSRIQDLAFVDNIMELTECFVSQIDPLKVILFGSFADGSYTEDSDYDFYIVVNDGRDISEATDKAYRAVRYVKRRPVDIVVGTNSRFERKGNSRHSLMVEGEVARNGILLYDQMATAMRRTSV